MSEALVVTIPGEPVAKGRPRFNRTTGRAYTPEKTRAAESIIAWHAKQAASAQGVELPMEGPICLSVSFATTHTAAGNTRRAGDIDNYVKTVQDALNGVAYVDDVQVVRIAACVDRSEGVVPMTTIVLRAEGE